MPYICSLPSDCPPEVQSEMESAFALFWSQPAACAGRIRVALELLMDHLGINGKTLDARIKEFAKVSPLEAGMLMAVKWLGNSGGHQSSVKKEDLLDGFEILEHTLVEIVELKAKRAKLAKLSEELEKKHNKVAKKKPGTTGPP